MSEEMKQAMEELSKPITSFSYIYDTDFAALESSTRLVPKKS